MKRALLIAVLLLAGTQVHAADYWMGPVNTGDGSGSDVNNQKAFNTANLLALGGGTGLTRGNTVYICGVLGNGSTTQIWTPGGVSGAASLGMFVLDGSCPGGTPGGWDMTGTAGIPIQIGGTSRDDIILQNFYMQNCTSNCMNLGGNRNIVRNMRFDNCGTTSGSCINMQGTSTSIIIASSTFNDWGAASSSAESGVNIVPSDGISIGGLTIASSTFTGNGIARYGVSLYPAGTVNSGNITNVRIADNAFRGSYSISPVNISRNADNNIVERNDFAGSQSGGAVIHVGGQGTIEFGCATGTSVAATSDNNIVRFNRNVQGATFNALNPADAVGIYADECSIGTQIIGNEAYGNLLSGIYLNDATGAFIAGNVLYDNDINCIHSHGLSATNTIVNNTCYHVVDANTRSLDQGADAFQFDGNNATNNRVYNNIIIGSASTNTLVAGIDADVAVEEGFNYIEGFHTNISGQNQNNAITTRQVFSGVTRTKGADFAILPTAQALGTHIGDYQDYFNRAFNTRPTIGAFERAARSFITNNATK